MKKLTLIVLILLCTIALPAARAQDGTTVTVVGGVDQPQTYPDQAQQGFSFTGQTYRSLYPGGMEFKAIITPPEGVTISRVTLFYAFATGKTGRVPAERGDNPNEWIATALCQPGPAALARTRCLLGRPHRFRQRGQPADPRRVL